LVKSVVTGRAQLPRRNKAVLLVVKVKVKQSS